MIIYLDEILVLSTTMEQCLIDAQIVVDTLASLGFMIKAKKSVTTPSQTFFYLGYLWDTVRMTCSLPPEKLDNIKHYCRGNFEEPVLPSETAPNEWNSSLSQTCSFSSKSNGLGLTKAHSNSIQVQDQRRVIEDDLLICLGQGEHRMVAGPHAGGVCPLLVLCSNMEEHSPGHRCLRHNVGSCAGWAGGNRRMGQAGGGPYYWHMLRRHLAFLSRKLVTWLVDNQNARLAFLNQGTVHNVWL